jgi:hypothetical protein
VIYLAPRQWCFKSRRDGGAEGQFVRTRWAEAGGAGGGGQLGWGCH